MYLFHGLKYLSSARFSFPRKVSRMAWNPNEGMYARYEPHLYAAQGSNNEAQNHGVREFYQYKGSKPPAAPTTYSDAGKTLFDVPIPFTGKRRSLLPWKRREEEKKEREEELRLAQKRHEEQQAALRRQLEEERKVRQMLEEKQREKEHVARQIALAEQDRKNQIIEGRLRREELESQRRREIEVKRMATSPEALQHLRELVRQRYELDMEIWQKRDVAVRDRPVIEQRMLRADMLLKEIQDTVRAWNIDEEVWTVEEIKLATEIRDRLLKDGKRNWRRQPPWASSTYRS